jgi:cysteine desulfurase
MSSSMIYLDHSATTMVDERVFEAMKPYFGELYGNPSSLHRQGQIAEAAIEQARQSVANLLACPANSILFTACATESNNIVLQGLAAHNHERQIPYHVLTTPVEHPSVLGPLRSIQARGEGMFSFLPVDHGGKLLSSEFEGLISADVSLVSVIYGNNEVGTLNPIEEIGSLLKDKPTFFHTDAVQCANFKELNVEQLGVDFLSLSAHKFYGPKGVGILYARDASLLRPIMQGGSQEDGLRPGTQNVPLIVGAAEALTLAQEIRTTESSRLRELRDAIIDAVTERIPDCVLTGDREQRLPHHASFAFAEIDSNQLLAALDLQGFACSSGSACKVGNPEPSELLLSLGFSEVFARGALRITLGRSSSNDHVEAFIDTLERTIERLRDRGRQQP